MTQTPAPQSSDPLDPRNYQGLSELQAQERLKTEGPNELPSSKQKSLLWIALDVLREPMLILLLVCGAIYIVLGDLKEALTLSGFVVIIIVITIYQERKTERSLEALRDLTSPRALVIRDGLPKRIAGRDVARGDILILAEGDRVAADSLILGVSNLQADESLLTGESVPVRKIQGKGDETATQNPGGDDLPFVFSGSLIVKGRAIAKVLSTGEHTEIGRIGKALSSLDIHKTHVEQEIQRIVKTAFVFAIALCTLVVAIYTLTRGHFLRAFLAGITLAMAMLPEEFPVVLAVFMALGAFRMSRLKVLARRAAAVEMLGAASVLCVDKTGTLTENRMTVRSLRSEDQECNIQELGGAELAETFHLLVEFGILASQRDPFDPMELAFHRLGQEKLEGTEHLHADWNLIREYPLSPELLALSHVWRSPGGDRFVIAAKGAPEAIFDLCHLDEQSIAHLRKQVSAMADRGLRVLGVARAYFGGEELPGQQHDFDFELLGLVGLHDPVRKGVKEAVADCKRAGIHVVMITGDYPGTARAIANEIGIQSENILTGPELAAMPEETLKERVGGISIFARVVPEQKLKLVQAFMARGDVVAMTGDGVNDAPALKAAHIGVAMGGRGTDVAREASALVVTDDNFTSIVDAVRMGRRVFDNLKKAMAYIIAVHVPIAGMSLIPVVFGWPLVLLPAHVLFMELVIDPACSVAFEAEPAEADIMQRPPRSATARLFGWRDLVFSVAQGLCVLGASLYIYYRALGMAEAGEDHARAMAFCTLIISNWALIMVNRSRTLSIIHTLFVKNTAALLVIMGALLVLVAVLYIPFLRSLFRFSPLSLSELLICAGLGIGAVVWVDILKWVHGHGGKRG